MELKYLNKYRVSFCKVCKNRKFNTQIGVICNITNEKASFEKVCEDFLLDKNERAYIKRKTIEKIVNNQKAKEKIYTRIFSNSANDYSFLVTDKLRIRYNLLRGVFDLNRIIELKNSQSKKSPYLIYGVLAIFFLLMMFKQYQNIQNNSVYIIVGILFIIGIYIFFNKYFETKIWLVLNSYGLIYKESSFIGWFEIVYAYFEIKYNNDNEYDGTYLVLQLEKQTEEIEISDLDIEKSELGEIIYAHLLKINKEVLPVDH